MNHFIRMANYSLVRRRLMSAPTAGEEKLGPKVVVRRRDSDFAQRRYAMEQERQQPLKAQFAKAAKSVQQPWSDILNGVAKSWGVTVEEITGRSRKDSISQARREAAYRLSVDSRLSNRQIAARLGRCHTTIIMLIETYAKNNNLPFKPHKLRPGRHSPELLAAVRARRGHASSKEVAAEFGLSHNVINGMWVMCAARKSNGGGAE